MKIKNKLSNMKDIFFRIKRYKNWRKINSSIHKGQKPNRVILRNGVQIDAPDDNTLLEMVEEILYPLQIKW